MMYTAETYKSELNKYKNTDKKIPQWIQVGLIKLEREWVIANYPEWIIQHPTVKPFRRR